MVKLTLQRIVAVVAEEFGETAPRLTGPIQAVEIATARHVAWGIAYATGLFTEGRLAKTFDRDMSTVRMGLKRLPMKLTDPAIAARARHACVRLGVDPRLLGLAPTSPVIARFVSPIVVSASFAWEVRA